LTRRGIENFTAYEDILRVAKEIFRRGALTLPPGGGGFDVIKMIFVSSEILGRKIVIEEDPKLHPDLAGFARRYPDHDLIVINGSLKRSVQRFAAAKELGHLHFAPRVVTDLEIPPSVILSQILTFGIDASTPAFPAEKVAFVFAMEVTMPSFDPATRRQISAYRHDPGRLAQIFGIPKTFVVWRLHPAYPPIRRRRGPQ
jgi:Zn-dependent peptidase ImmA (M78 family)